MKQKIVLGLKYFFLIFTIVSIICLAVFLNMENNKLDNKLSEIKHNEEIFVNVKSDHVVESFIRAITNLKYISTNYDPSDSEYLIKWNALLESNQAYSKIIYYDLKGYERIRLDYPEPSESIDKLLSTESVIDRDYFQKALSLKEGQFYISNINMMYEEGEEDIDLSIMFCTPYFNKEAQGIFVLEYDADSMLKRFGEHIEDSNGIVYIINEYGYWNSETQEYSSIVPEYYELAYSSGILPSEKWEEIREVGYKLSKEGLYTFAELDLFSININHLFNDSDEIILADNSTKIVTYIKGEGEYKYLFSGEFHLKAAKIFSEKFIFFILCFLASAALAVYLIVKRSRLETIKNSSHFDSLTKAYTRRQGFIILEEYISNIKYYKKICLCFIDINGLKEVNDTLGHPLGDELIVTVSDTIKKTIRQEDILIRMGGDEFLIVFMKVEKAIAETIWTRISNMFKDINIKEDRDYNISVSHGVVEIDSKDESIDLNTLITLADSKMYKEKIRVKKNLTIIRDK